VGVGAVVDVDVIAFVIVAVHLNVNDTVGVIVPVDLPKSHRLIRLDEASRAVHVQGRRRSRQRGTSRITSTSTTPGLHRRRLGPLLGGSHE
jgi:hypothetical protein